MRNIVSMSKPNAFSILSAISDDSAAFSLIRSDNRVIFKLGGNKYRLVVHVYYPHQIVRTKFVGTHSQYDRIDPETVEP